MTEKVESALTFIIKNLYTNKTCKWINQLDDYDIRPFSIQRVLSMNDHLRSHVRWLDKYVFPLQEKPKMYLSLAWSILPKVPKAPFYPYIKALKKEEEFDFIFSKIRKHFKMSDNDFRSMKDRLLSAIRKDMVKWFSYYGVEKKKWKQYYLNFNQIKEFGVESRPKTAGLDTWGL